MPIVKVHSRTERGFFRCGRFWPAAGAEVEVTAEELARIRSEPNLIVVRVREAGDVGASVTGRGDTEGQAPASVTGVTPALSGVTGVTPSAGGVDANGATGAPQSPRQGAGTARQAGAERVRRHRARKRLERARSERHVSMGNATASLAGCCSPLETREGAENDTELAPLWPCS